MNAIRRLVLLSAVVVGGLARADARAAERPNVIVFLVDDMGYSDIGCFGGEVPTPNLDKLAADGLRMTQFYNTPRCSPTRSALLTGLYSHQAGFGWLDNKVEPKSRGFHGRLLPRCVTIAEVLGEAGYFTAMTGKWHLGQQNGTPPWERGFQRSMNSRYGEVYFPKESDRPGKAAPPDRPPLRRPSEPAPRPKLAKASVPRADPSQPERQPTNLWTHAPRPVTFGTDAQRVFNRDAHP